MAAYGRGDYGAGDYSIGAYFGAFDITSSSNVTAAGVKVLDGTVVVASASVIDISAEKITTASASITSTSLMTASGGVEAVAEVNFEAQSNLEVDSAISKLYLANVNIESGSLVGFKVGLTMNNGRARVNASSLMTLNAREKWELIPDVQTNWTTVS